MEETVDCDKVVIIDRGRIAAEGTPHSLKQKYASNRLVWYADRSGEAESMLNENGLDFDYQAGSYSVDIDSCENATRLLALHREISDYEFIKGNMDDVFLNVTGKRLGD